MNKMDFKGTFAVFQPDFFKLQWHFGLKDCIMQQCIFKASASWQTELSYVWKELSGLTSKFCLMSEESLSREMNNEWIRNLKNK